PVESDQFAQVRLESVRNVVREANIVPVDGALRLGDLVRVWGQPEVRSAGQTVTYTWPAQHATARGTVLQLPTSFHTRITLIMLTGGAPPLNPRGPQLVAD